MNHKNLQVTDSDLKNIVYIIAKIIIMTDTNHYIDQMDLKRVALNIDCTKLHSLNTFIENNREDYLAKLNYIKNAWVRFRESKQTGGAGKVRLTVPPGFKNAVKQAARSSLEYAKREIVPLAREVGQEVLRTGLSTGAQIAQDTASQVTTAALRQQPTYQQPSQDSCTLYNQYSPYTLKLYEECQRDPNKCAEYSQYREYSETLLNQCQQQSTQAGGGETDSQCLNNIYNLCNKYQPNKSTEMDNIFLSQYSNTMTETDKDINPRILKGNSLFTVDDS